ncbi:MAG: glycosyltransferase family 4 protein [Nitrospinae bacterium]|nr:glycosyltransferase family 4 protein [Nitrospinota bacterium]
MKKTVLVVSIPIVPPWNQASKNFAINLARHSRHDFILMSTHNGREGNVFFERFYSSKNIDLTSFQKIFMLMKFLLRKNSGIDILHFVFEPNPAALSIWSWVAKIMRKPCVHTLLNLLDERQDCRKLLFADRITVCTNKVLRQLREKQVENVSLIVPGIHVENFARREKRPEIFKKYGLPERPIILFPGTYYPHHGMETMFESFLKIIKTRNDVSLVSACRVRTPLEESEEARFKKKALEMRLQDKIFFLRIVPDMAELLSLSDVCVFPPSLLMDKASVPLIVLEAAAAELPVVATNIPTLDEIKCLHPDFTVPPLDSSLLAEKILQLLRDKNLSRSVAAWQKEAVTRYYDARNMAQEYDLLYDRLI